MSGRSWNRPAGTPGVRASLKGWGRRPKPQRQSGALTADVLAVIRLTAVQPRLSLFRIYRPVNWEFFRIYPPDFQGHQATLGATSAIIAALWN